MPNARPSIARSVPLFLILATAAPAAAQITFRGIPTGTPPEEARTRLQALGYRYLGVDGDPDQVYQGPTGSELVLMAGPRGVVQFEETWEGPQARMRTRFRALSDSLHRAVGRHDGRSGEGDVVEWNRGDSWMQLLLAADSSSRYRSPFTRLTLGSSAYVDELRRRAEQRRQTGGEPPRDPRLQAGRWETVGGQGRTEIMVDVDGVTRPAPGVYRTRRREEWWWSRRMTNGRAYSGEILTVELDCGRMRWRQLGAMYFSGHQVVEGTPLDATRSPRGWTVPARGTASDRVLRASCDAVGAVRFRAAQVRILGMEWGTPAGQVRTQLEACGYRFRSVDDRGDHVFSGTAASEARARFDSAGLVQLALRWTGTPAAMQRRFRDLSDSLTRALGSPTRPSEYPWELYWKGEGAQLISMYGPPGRHRSLAEAALLGQSDTFVAAGRRLDAP